MEYEGHSEFDFEIFNDHLNGNSEFKPSHLRSFTSIPSDQCNVHSLEHQLEDHQSRIEEDQSPKQYHSHSHEFSKVNQQCPPLIHQPIDLQVLHFQDTVSKFTGVIEQKTIQQLSKSSIIAKPKRVQSRKQQASSISQFESNNSLQISKIPRSYVKSKNVFYLRGEIFLDLNSGLHQWISNLNYYKQVRCVRYLHEINSIYSEYEVFSQLYDSHSAAIAMLQRHPNQDVQELSVKLREHESSLVRDAEIKHRIADILLSNPFIQSLVRTQHEEFLLFRKQILAQIPKTSYFSFVDYDFDYSQMTFQINGNGLSELFVKFLGCDLSSIIEIAMRKGILEFFEAHSRWKLLNSILNFSNQKFPFYHAESHEGRITLITFDDISVDTLFTASFYHCKSAKLLESFFHPAYQNFLFDRGFVVFQFHITDYHIQLINSQREKIAKQEYQSDMKSLRAPLLQAREYSNQTTSKTGETCNVLKEFTSIMNEGNNKLNQEQNYQNIRGTSLYQQNVEKGKLQTNEEYERMNERGKFLPEDKIFCEIGASNNEQQFSREIAFLKASNEKPFCYQQEADNNYQGRKSCGDAIHVVQELIYDIPYGEQASLFFDKFYKKKETKKDAHQSVQDKNPEKTCKYKFISNNYKHNHSILHRSN